MFSHFDILIEIYNGLEISQFKIDNLDFKEVLENRNPKRVINLELSKEEELFKHYSLQFSIAERLNLIYGDEELYLKVSAFSNMLIILINSLSKKVFCEHFKDEIFLQIFKYAIIPFFIRKLDNIELEIIKELLPDKKENSAEKFMKFTEIAILKIEETKLFKNGDIDISDLDSEVERKLKDNFRKRVKEDSLPKTNLIFRNFKNSTLVLRYFTYSKLIHHFFFNTFTKELKNREERLEIVEFTKELIEDKLKRKQNRVLTLNYDDIIYTIIVNLYVKENIYFSELTPQDSEKILEIVQNMEESCRVKRFLDENMENTLLNSFVSDYLKIDREEDYLYESISLLKLYDEQLNRLQRLKDRGDVSSLNKMEQDSIKDQIKEFLKRVKDNA